jgi:hypothetical protein
MYFQGNLLNTNILLDILEMKGVDEAIALAERTTVRWQTIKKLKPW